MSVGALPPNRAAAARSAGAACGGSGISRRGISGAAEWRAPFNSFWVSSENGSVMVPPKHRQELACGFDLRQPEQISDKADGVAARIARREIGPTTGFGAGDAHFERPC